MRRRFEIPCDYGDRGPIRLDKLLVECGLADSTADANRKIKQKAVRVRNVIKNDPRLPLLAKPTDTLESFYLRVGRRMKFVVLHFQ